MRFRVLLAFLVGVGFFTVLPIYAPWVVMQSTEIPRLYMGLGAGVVAGAVLLYEVPTFGPPPGRVVGGYLMLISITFGYGFLPATVGVVLMVLACSLVARFRRS